jgi:hypothetical protein
MMAEELLSAAGPIERLIADKPTTPTACEVSFGD